MLANVLDATGLTIMDVVLCATIELSTDETAELEYDIDMVE